MKKRVTIKAVAEYDEEHFDDFSDEFLEDMVLDAVRMGDFPVETSSEVIHD